MVAAFPPEMALSRPARLRRWAEGSRLGCPDRVSATALVSYIWMLLSHHAPWPSIFYMVQCGAYQALYLSRDINLPKCRDERSRLANFGDSK